MTIVQVTCDRCRRPIASDRVRLVVEGSSVALPWQDDPATGRPTLDLCGPCLGRLGEWLDNPADPGPG